jgi:hypothetical protein
MASTGEALLGRVEVRPIEHAGRSRIRFLLPVLVIALAVIPKLFFLRVGVLGMDESILLIYPEQLLDGRVPNRDFFTVYGPGNFWVLAGAFSLLGQSFIVERLVGLTYQALIVAGVMALTRRHGAGAAIAAGVLSALMLTGPNLLALSWMGGLALSVWSLALLHVGGQRAAIVAGSLAGLATCWRFEMAVLALAAVPILLGDPRWRRYLPGCVLGSAPTVLHLTVAGRATLNNVILERMGLNSQRDPSLLMPSVAVLAALLALAGLGLVVYAMRRRDRVTASSAIFAVLLLPQAFQRVDFPHVVLMTGCVVFPLALAPALSLVRRSAPHGLVAVAIGFALLTMCVEAALMPGASSVRHEGRTLYVDHATKPAVEQLLDAVTEHVEPGARVFVGSTDMSVPTTTAISLYQLLPEYRNDFYYLELPVGVAEKRGSPLVADIESADALILTQHDPNLRALYPHFGSGVEDANRAVEKGFCAVERVMDTTLLLPC